MRRLLADRLVLVTGVIVILMSIAFAFLRVAGANNDADGQWLRTHLRDVGHPPT